MQAKAERGVEEATFTVQGVIISKDLPLLWAKVSLWTYNIYHQWRITANQYKYLRQGVILSGLGLPTFQNASVGRKQNLWPFWLPILRDYFRYIAGITHWQTAMTFHASAMVHAWSHSFQRTIIGWLWWSLRWWPPHHCSVPSLSPATLIGLISDFCWNSSSTMIPPTNHHSYHCHCQPAPHAIYHSTTRAPPCSTHVPCCRPIISHTHQFSRSWVLVTTRTWKDLSQHSLPSFRVWVFSLYDPLLWHSLNIWTLLDLIL